jgi:hypothetical protein
LAQGIVKLRLFMAVSVSRAMLEGGVYLKLTMSVRRTRYFFGTGHAWAGVTPFWSAVKVNAAWLLQWKGKRKRMRTSLGPNRI